jgi:hypothetical protein
MHIQELTIADLDQAIQLRSQVFEQREVMNSYLGVTADENAVMSKQTMPKILEAGLSVGAFDGDKLVGILLLKPWSLIDDPKEAMKVLPKSFEPIVVAISQSHQLYMTNLIERAKTDERARKILASLDDDETRPILFSTAAIAKGYEGKGLAMALTYTAVWLILSKRPNTSCMVTEATGERSQALAKKVPIIARGQEVSVLEYSQVHPAFKGIPNNRDGSPARLVIYEFPMHPAKIAACSIKAYNIVTRQHGQVLGIPFKQYNDYFDKVSTITFLSSLYEYVPSMYIMG